MRLVAFLFVLAFVHTHPRVATAVTCQQGCSAAAKLCKTAEGIHTKGCLTGCDYQYFMVDKPACDLINSACTMEKTFRAACRLGCKSGPPSSCVSLATTCNSACLNKPGLCSIGCAVTNGPGALKPCAKTGLEDLSTNKGSCPKDNGSCFHTAANTAQSDLGACGATFSTCMGGCP